MTLAVNDAGDVLSDASGAWKPAMQAVNDKTGESLALDGGAWRSMPKTQSQDDPNPAFSQDAVPNTGSAQVSQGVKNVGSAAVEGAKEGFGHPVGQTILSPEAQAWMDDKQRQGGVGGFLAGLGSTAAEDIGTGLGVVGGVGSALFRGTQSAAAQVGDELPQVKGLETPDGGYLKESLASLANPQLAGRDIAAYPESRMGSAYGFREGIPGASIADIGKASDIDGAIAAAGKAVEAPSAPYQPITAREVQARDGVDTMEAWSRANAENTAGATKPDFVPPDAAHLPLEGADASAARPEPAATTATPTPSYPDLGDILHTGPADVPKTGVDTMAEAKAVASAYYAKAEDVGGTLRPEVTNRFVDQAEKIAPQTPEGQAVAGNTAITELVDRLQALRDQPISLAGAQEIYERLGDLEDKEYGLKGLSKEGHDLQELRITFRDMLNNAGPEDTIGGTEGFDAFKQGRAAWAQAMKMSDLERILNRAQMTDNPATSIRAGIRALLNNESRLRGYTDVEKAALKDAMNRGALGGVLHVFGNRLTPIAVGAAGMSGGFLPGLLAAGATHLGTTTMRNWATGLQTGRVNNAISVLGSRVPPPPQ